MPRMLRRLFLLPLAGLAALLLLPLSAPAADAVRVTDAWARATVPGQKVAGVYMQIISPIDSRLVAVSAPVAKQAEVHSMKMEDGTMKMRPLKALDLPAGTAVKLEPGGLHVMLFGVESPLAVGQQFPLTLTVEMQGGRKRDVTVQVRVRGREQDAGAGQGHRHDHH